MVLEENLEKFGTQSRHSCIVGHTYGRTVILGTVISRGPDGVAEISPETNCLEYNMRTIYATRATGEEAEKLAKRPISSKPLLFF